MTARCSAAENNKSDGFRKSVSADIHEKHSQDFVWHKSDLEN